MKKSEAEQFLADMDSLGIVSRESAIEHAIKRLDERRPPIREFKLLGDKYKTREGAEHRRTLLDNSLEQYGGGFTYAVVQDDDGFWRVVRSKA